MAQLIWSPLAMSNLDEICDYIAQDSPEAARNFAVNVHGLVGTIPGQPFLGAMVPEYDDPNLRERQHRSYRILYRLNADDVEVVTIVHGARLLPRRPPA